MILTNSIHAPLILSFGAALLYTIIAFNGRFFNQKLRLVTWTLAWLLHAITVFYPLSSDKILFGFGPAISCTAWLVLFVYALESHTLPQLQSHFRLLLLAALAVLLAAFFPGKAVSSPDIFWQPVHWALGIASYSIFGVAIIHASLAIRAEKQLRKAIKETAPAAEEKAPAAERAPLEERSVEAASALERQQPLFHRWSAHPALHGHQHLRQPHRGARDRPGQDPR